MNFYKNIYYEVTDKCGAFKIGDRFETLDEAKKAKQTSIQKQKEAGYTPYEYIIVCVVWTKITEDNGILVTETTSRNRVTEPCG